MTGRIGRSCFFYGLLASGVGIGLTLLLHLMVHNSANVWHPQEPQLYSVAVLYGVIGAVLRYFYIQVYTYNIRGFGDVEPRLLNVRYESAMVFMAILFVTPLLLFKLFVLEIQLPAIDRSALLYRTLVGPKDPDLLTTLSRGWLAPWPIGFYELVGLVAGVSAAAGGLRRANQRNDYLPAVVTVYGIVGALKYFLIALLIIFLPLAIMAGVTDIFHIDFNPDRMNPTIRQIILWPIHALYPWALFLAPVIGGAWAIRHRLSPAGKQRLRAEVLYTPSLTQRFYALRRFAYTTGRVNGTIIGLVFMAALCGGLWSFAWWCSLDNHNAAVFYGVIASIVTVICAWRALMNVGELWAYLFPNKPPKLDPTTNLHGEKKPAGESEVDKALKGR